LAYITKYVNTEMFNLNPNLHNADPNPGFPFGVGHRPWADNLHI